MSRHCRLAMTSFALAVLLLPALARAQWSSDPAVNLLVAGTPVLEWYPTSAPDGAGGLFVAWADGRDGLHRWGRLQHLDAQGVPRWTVNGVLVCGGSNWEDSLQVVADGAGGAIVAWSDGRAGNSRVYAQRFDALGTRLWDPDGVLLAAGPLQMEPMAIVSDAAGGAIVGLFGRPSAWYALPSFAVQRVTAEGGLPWGAVGVNLFAVDAVGFPTRPMLTADDAGGALLAWHQREGSTYEVVAQHVTGAGTLAWGAGGLRMGPAGTWRLSPSIVRDGGDGAIVLWHDATAPYGVRAQRFDGGGAPLWGSAGVQVWASGEAANDSLIADGAGGAYAIHGRYLSSVQHLTPAGARSWPGEGVVPVTTSETRLAPVLAVTRTTDPGGAGLLIAWVQPSGAQYTQQEIRAQRLSPAGDRLWGDAGVQVSSVEGVKSYVRANPDLVSGLIVTWLDHGESPNPDVYAKRVAADGSLGTAGAPGPGAPVALIRPAPNPARAGIGAAIRCRLSSVANSRVAVIDLGGRAVRVLFDGSFAFAMFGAIPPWVEITLHWDGRDASGARVAPGIYFVCVQSPGFAGAARLAIVD